MLEHTHQRRPFAMRTGPFGGKISQPGFPPVFRIPGTHSKSPQAPVLPPHTTENTSADRKHHGPHRGGLDCRSWRQWKRQQRFSVTTISPMAETSWRPLHPALVGQSALGRLHILDREEVKARQTNQSTKTFSHLDDTTTSPPPPSSLPGPFLFSRNPRLPSGFPSPCLPGRLLSIPSWKGGPVLDHDTRTQDSRRDA